MIEEIAYICIIIAMGFIFASAYLRDRRVSKLLDKLEQDPNTNFSGKPQEFGGCYHDTKKKMTKQEWRTI